MPVLPGPDPVKRRTGQGGTPGRVTLTVNGTFLERNVAERVACRPFATELAVVRSWIDVQV